MVYSISVVMLLTAVVSVLLFSFHCTYTQLENFNHTATRFIKGKTNLWAQTKCDSESHFASSLRTKPRKQISTVTPHSKACLVRGIRLGCWRSLSF
ncbi:hypothetical protein ZEAMMB73_Zm00001d044186 [Zea mays]|uniref:Uncharacterized protein n=1 Tax=Zea mays TaxID=4577 RepID=A0A1D6NJ82_MAIZE|nr:hypothetical protein ZEAMMB73_Zm00001d044186 [Zea mays]